MCYDRAGQPTIIVDYAHTPDALEKRSLPCANTFRIITSAVFLGVVVIVIVQSDRLWARSRPALLIALCLQAITPVVKTLNLSFVRFRAGVEGADLHVNADRAEAIREAIHLASGNGIIVIAGKGHEDYQELASGRVPFSDYAVIDEVMSAGAVTE